MAKWKQHFSNELKVDRDFSLTLICSFGALFLYGYQLQTVLNMKLNWDLPENLYFEIMMSIIYGKALGLDDPKGMLVILGSL